MTNYDTEISQLSSLASKLDRELWIARACIDELYDEVHRLQKNVAQYKSKTTRRMNAVDKKLKRENR